MKAVRVAGVSVKGGGCRVKAVFESCSPVVMCMFDLGSLLMMMMMTLWPCLPLKPKLGALLVQSLVFVVDHQQRIASGVYILIVESKYC